MMKKICDNAVNMREKDTPTKPKRARMTGPTGKKFAPFETDFDNKGKSVLSWATYTRRADRAMDRTTKARQEDEEYAPIRQANGMMIQIVTTSLVVQSAPTINPRRIPHHCYTQKSIPRHHSDGCLRVSTALKHMSQSERMP